MNITIVLYTSNNKNVIKVYSYFYSPIITARELIATALGGAEACRTLISHVSNKWETEKCFGSFRIRA